MAQSEADRFLRQLEHPQREQLLYLKQLIQELHPHLRASLWGSGSTVGFGRYHYRYKSGREGEWFLIGFAPCKGYISLYAMATRDGRYLAEIYKERYRDQLSKVKVGKSCLNIRDLNAIPKDILKEFIREAVSQMESYCREQGWKIAEQ